MPPHSPSTVDGGPSPASSRSATPSNLYWSRGINKSGLYLLSDSSTDRATANNPIVTFRPRALEKVSAWLLAAWSFPPEAAMPSNMMSVVLRHFWNSSEIMSGRFSVCNCTRFAGIPNGLLRSGVLRSKMSTYVTLGLRGVKCYGSDRRRGATIEAEARPSSISTQNAPHVG